MNRPVTKGMILAAGLGTRLLPITEQTPKPLVPVLNVPNLLYSIALLRRAGIEDIIINTHHLADAIEEYFGDGSRWGVRLSYSREDILLGTGGGVKKAGAFFGGEPFVLANSDFISNIDLVPVIRRHRERNAVATMILIQDPMLQAFYSKVGTDAEGHLCSLPSLEIRVPGQTGMFTGIHVLQPETLDYLEEKPSGINQVLYPALMKEAPERIYGDFLPDCYWFDTGNLYFLWMTSMRLLERLKRGDRELAGFLREYGGLEELDSGIWGPAGGELPSHCVFSPPVILGNHCDIGRGSSLGPYTVVGDGARVKEGNRLARFVALPGGRTAREQKSESGLLFGGELLQTKRLG